MSLDFFPCKIPIPYDASYVYDACNVLVKSYSKSIVATMHGIVLVKSTTGNAVAAEYPQAQYTLTATPQLEVAKAVHHMRPKQYVKGIWLCTIYHKYK